MNINIAKTKNYYNAISESDLCDCSYCRIFRQQIKSSYPNISTYLDSLGIDIEKPFETSPLEPDENGKILYCACQYVVFGNCEREYAHKIGEVSFRAATSYPDTGIKDTHFVLEFFPVELEFR
ncbi:MAG: hypothetical protein IJA31_08135 [Clostridia bacterium]|nr:hypothetical protein [Clostridia bacterium]